MAGAHAKFTGEPGVCLATPGPGAIHLLNGFYDAGMDHQPVCRMTCAFGLLCAESSGEEIRLHSEPEAESSQRDSDCHHSPTLWSGLIPCCPKTHDSEQLAEHHPDNEHGRTQPQSGSPLQKAAWAPHPGVSADST